jgi:Ca2+-binding RTX toxin-like protein
MSVKGRGQPGIYPGTPAASSALGLTDDDLTRLDLDDLIELPLGTAGDPSEPRAEQTAERPGNGPDPKAPVDFTTLDLEQLLSLSVSSDAEDDQIDEAKTKDDATDEASDAVDQSGEGQAGNGGGANQVLELQVEPVEWLWQEDDFTLSAGGYGFYDPGVDPTAGAQSLQFGGGTPSPLGNLPVPGAIPPSPPSPSNPIQTWFTPFAIDMADGTVGESWSVADAVGRVTASGADAQVSFGLVDDAGGRFAIDSETGEVSIVAGPFDFTAQSGYTIVVEASDGGRTLQQSFTIQVSPSDLDALGQPGDQTLVGAGANFVDVLFGGAGNDSLSGLNNNDQLYGGSGDDLLVGGNQDDMLFGGSGDDVLLGGNHDDQLYGGTGADALYGENHDDVLFGGGGDDQLFGGDGSDWLDGEGGQDWLDGGAGSDVLIGGADDDVLVWDAADHRFDGGDGDDELLVVAGDIDLSAFAGQVVSIESVNLLSDPGANTLTLTAADVLDITDNGLLSVLGDGQDRVVSDPGWTLAQVDTNGFQLYVASVGLDEVAGLLLGPGVQFDPQDGG